MRRFGGKRGEGERGEVTNVVIQAGGRGQRLLPYTTVLPKPLMPVAGLPILEIVIRQLVRCGLGNVTVTLGYLGDLIEAVVARRQQWGASVQFVTEEEPLGTIGAITLVPDLREPFIVMNGDILTDLDYGAFLADHIASGADLSIATYTKDVSISLGVFDFDGDGKVNGFKEKPTYRFPCSMGIYAFSPQLLDIIPRGVHFGFDDLIERCLADDISVRAHQHEGLWLDIGRHEDYEDATKLFVDNRDRLLPEPGPTAARSRQRARGRSTRGLSRPIPEPASA
jgi:NDP-mannose synthase